MPKHSLPFVTSILLLVLGGCSAPTPPPQPEFRVTATVKDLMESIFDPSSDFIWDSIETNITEKGIEEKVPHTNEEWAEVRHHAIDLVEGTNLLLLPGRKIAEPGYKSEDPSVLPPDQIEARVNQDRAQWTKMVHRLNDAGMEALKAIDAKDPQGLIVAGDALDKACGDCHNIYWYPGEYDNPQTKS